MAVREDALRFSVSLKPVLGELPFTQPPASEITRDSVTSRQSDPAGLERVACYLSSDARVTYGFFAHDDTLPMTLHFLPDLSACRG